MTPTRLLHISDVHFEPPRGRGDRARIQKALLAKVLELEFDAVVFSGDIANEGKETEYQVAQLFLKELARDRKILIVPGNHDVDRSRVDKKAMLNASASKEHFEENRPDVLKPKRFDAFVKFASSFELKWNRKRMTLACCSLSGVTFLGINTALLSYRKEDRGKLAVDTDDLENELGHLAADVPVVGIGHHPLEELNQWNGKLVRSAFERSLRGVHLYLCGHRHEQKGEAKYATTGAGLTVYQAGAAYQASPWEKSFSLLEIDMAERCLHTTLFRYNDDNGTFDPDPSCSRDMPVLWPIKESHNVAVPEVSAATEPTDASPSPPNSPEELIGRLEEVFDLVWESERADRRIGHVFWPVRLRRPTLIHAAQAYIAGAFQKLGVEVILCLDDFGNTGGLEPNFFLDRMRKHFSYVGADWDALEVIRASEIVTDDRVKRTWELLAAWLTLQPELQGVLSICKLLVQQARDAENLQKALKKKPRKLMTPAVVWTCLDHVLTQRGRAGDLGTSLATLGGHDEREFWRAWQAAFGAQYGKVGHLYGSALNKISAAPQEADAGGPLAMAEHDFEEDLNWHAMDDIRRTLGQDVGPVTNPHRILGWLICQCLILPTWLAGKSLEVCGKHLRGPRDLASLTTISRDEVVRDVAARANEVLLG